MKKDIIGIVGDSITVNAEGQISGENAVVECEIRNGKKLSYKNNRCWIDTDGKEYTAVAAENAENERAIIGFVKKNTLNGLEKEILKKAADTRAYIRYNEEIGGEPLLHDGDNYPCKEIENYLENHTMEELYLSCINAGITWYEMFRYYPV